MNTNQVQQVTTLMDEERNQRREAFRAARRGEMPFPEAMSQHQKLRQQTDEKVKALLDSSQYQGYVKMRDEQGGHFGGGRGGGAR